MGNVSRTRRLPYFFPLFFLLLVLAPVTARAVPVVALMDNNQFVLFDSDSPGTSRALGQLRGTHPGDRLIAIDFRPATGQLYGFSTGDRLYVIDLPSLSVVKSFGPHSPAIDGNSVGFDFDPSGDLIRVVRDEGQSRQNLVLHPDPNTSGGLAAPQTPAAFAAGDVNANSQPGVQALAYDNNFLGAAHSRLWAIHRNRGLGVPFLVTIAPGGGGQMRTVGPLLGTGSGAIVTDDIGFDIAPASGAAYAVMKISSPTITTTHLYSVDLATGAAHSLGVVGEPGTILDIAVVPPPLIVYAVNEQNELIKFNSASPSTVISRVPITGTTGGEQIFNLDFRPATDFRPGREELYGLGRSCCGPGATSHIYTINPETGVAQVVGPSNPLDPAPVGDAGFDFDPTIDRIRIVTSTEQNLLADPDLGAVVVTGHPLAYAVGDPNAGRDPNVLAAAYSNNFPGARSATLYVIDRDHPGFGTRLARVGPPAPPPPPVNDGRMFTVGPVGFGVPVDHVGFDIAPGIEGTALVSTISMDEGFSRLSVFNVHRPGAAQVGPVGAPGHLERLRDLAVVPTGTFTFASDLFIVKEDHTAVEVVVTRTGDLSNEAAVDYTTSDARQPDDFGFISRADYTPARGTLFFAAGQAAAAIKILINEDAHVERREDHGVVVPGDFFQLRLSNPTNGHTLGDAAKRTTTVLIEDDDDTAATPNPINSSDPFVRQHYHDFLNREADAEGLAFWTNNIESCGADAACRAVKRIDTSAAFFLSGEFQSTGLLVYRAYAAAFGPTRVGGTVPLTFAEFLPDTQRVSRGVVIGQPDAPARIENNRRAYFDEFVQRAAFEARYPRALPAGEFIDALNANTGGSLTPAERDALVSGLQSGAETRATALRKVVENNAFRQRELNRAFVLMQYFGYLRRNPDDAPEEGRDFAGYNFWLQKLDGFGGDFRRAEMVKAFITSTEYRRRFGNP